MRIYNFSANFFLRDNENFIQFVHRIYYSINKKSRENIIAIFEVLGIHARGSKVVLASARC